MTPFQLTNVQKRNLLAAQNDLDAIDKEITLAQNAGLAIDAELLQTCSECRDRLYRIHETYFNRQIDEKGKTNEPISGPKGQRRIIP